MSSRWLFLLLLLPTFASTSFAQSNGSERGGGDPYVGEFKDIRRRILPSVENWVKTGVLKIDDKQFKRLILEGPTVEVFSQPRVYLNPNDPATEVDAVNEPKRIPPRITLGRIRWDELKKRTQVEVDVFVLHELLCVLGISDKDFERSFELKSRQTVEWTLFIAKVFGMVRDLNDSFLRQVTKVNLELGDAYLSALALDSDYARCLDTSSKRKKAIEERNQACTRFAKKIEEASKYITKNASEPVLEAQEKMNVQATEIENWLHELMLEKDPLGSRFGNSKYMVGTILYLTYKNHLTQNIPQIQREVAETLTSENFQKKCPKQPRDFFHVTLTCFMDYYRSDAHQVFENGIKKMEDTATQAFEKFQAKVNEYLDPPSY